jgi:hypothetical protein
VNASFFAQTAEARTSLASSERIDQAGAALSSFVSDVSRTDLVSSTAISDEAREELISGYAKLMEGCIKNCETDGANYFLWMGEAHRCKASMYALIAGRSPEYAARLEAARGLA